MKSLPLLLSLLLRQLQISDSKLIGHSLSGERMGISSAAAAAVARILASVRDLEAAGRHKASVDCAGT